MSTLAESFRVLQDEIRRRNKIAHTADSIKALASVADILKTPHIPEATFVKLTLILRSRMLPLYRIILKSALRYATAILAAISDIKSRNPDDVKQKILCDNAQKSLLSGVLDYLEQNQTNENQALVASALYPILCREFFPRPNNSVADAQDTLFCTVFQVLSESAISHPGNQHKLRDPNVLGGKRLGLMLRQCKDFIALEALLELIGNVIPSSKKPERRSDFIQEVFDPTQFACSREIIQTLESISCAGWDATSTKIFDALAKLDPSYPQPFETTQIRFQKATYTVSRIYADKNAFIASVDEDGQFETFQLPFHSVKRIQVSSPSAFMATVTVSVSSSPLLGHSPIVRDKTDEISIAFDLRKERSHDFVTILRKRGLKCVLGAAHEKQSKAERNVELSFKSENHINPPPLEEKIENLTKLWESSKSPADNGDDNVATSPLHISPGTVSEKGGHVKTSSVRNQNPNSLEISASQTNINRTKPQLDAIFGASDEELSEISDLEVVGNRTELTEEGKGPAVLTRVACPPSFQEKDKRAAKTRPAGRMRVSAEPLDMLEVTQEANDGRAKSNVKGKLASHHPVSPAKSTSDTLPNRKSARYVRKNRIVSMESDVGDTHLAISEGVTSDPSLLPPLGDGVTGGSTQLYAEATSTVAATRGTGTVASYDISQIHEAFEIIPASNLLIKKDREAEVTQSNDKHERDVYEVLGSLRPKVHTNDVEMYATSDDGFGKTSTGQIDHLLSKASGRREQSKSGLTKPRKTDGSRTKTLIDLTNDDLDYGVGEVNEGPAGARAIKPTEGTEKVKKVTPIVEESISMTGGPLSRQPKGENLEDVTFTHATNPRAREVDTPRASVSFVLPTRVNENTHIATERKQTQFVFLRSRQKGHRVETSIQTQTSHQQSTENYFGRPKSDADIPRIAEVISQIHEAVINKVARGFDDVRSDIRVTRQKILEGTAKNMQAMQIESARHYDEMVNLANEYVNHERKTAHALYQLLGSESDMVQGIQDIIQTHDRFSLSSKFPKSLLPTTPAPFDVNSVVI